MGVRSQFLTYGGKSEPNLTLHSGRTFGPVTLVNETFGEPNKQKNHAVLVFHALSGSQHLADFIPELSTHETKAMLKK